MIPKTTTFKQFKEKKAREAADGLGVEAGQQTLDGRSFRQAGEVSDNFDSRPTTNGHTLERQDPAQMPLPFSPISPAGPSIMSPVNGSPIVDRTLPHGGHRLSYGEDVQMSG